MVALDMRCKQLGASYILADAGGLFGFVFVRSSRNSTVPRQLDTINSLSLCSIVPGLRINRIYKLEVSSRELLRIIDLKSSVFLSTLPSGGLEPNYHLSSPVPDTKEAALSDINNLDPTTVLRNAREDCKKVFEFYYEERGDAPCPLSGIEFSIERIDKDRALYINDKKDVLRDCHERVKSISVRSPRVAVSHLPLSSTYFLDNSISTQSDQLGDAPLSAATSSETTQKISSAFISVSDGQMEPSLSTYVKFVTSKILRSNTACGGFVEGEESEFNENLWKRLNTTESKMFAPTTSLIAATVAQELFKIATSTGASIRQWLLFDSPALAELIVVDELSSSDTDTSIDETTVSSGFTSTTASRREKLDDFDKLLFSPLLYPRLDVASFTLVGDDPMTFEVLKNIGYSCIGGRGEPKLLSICSDDNPLWSFSRPLFPSYTSSTTSCQQISRMMSDYWDRLWRATSSTSKFSSLKIIPIVSESHDENARSKLSPFLDQSTPSSLVILSSRVGSENIQVNSECCLYAVPMIYNAIDRDLGSVRTIIPRVSKSFTPLWVDNTSIPLSSLTFLQSPSSCIRSAKHLLNTTFSDDSYLIWKAMRELQAGTKKIENFSNDDLPLVCAWLLAHRSTLESCVDWAIEWCIKRIVLPPRDLLRSFPISSRKSDGEPFWKSMKTPPKTITFEIGEIIMENEDFRGDRKRWTRALVQNAILGLTVIHALRCRILPLNKGEHFGDHVDYYCDTLREQVIQLARDILANKKLEVPDDISPTRENAKALLLSKMDAKHEFCPVQINRKSLKASGTFGRILEAITNLKSQCFGNGIIPLYMIRSFLYAHKMPNPATSMAVAALTTIETIKVLLLPEWSAKPPLEGFDNGKPYRDHHLHRYRDERIGLETSSERKNIFGESQGHIDASPFRDHFIGLGSSVFQSAPPLEAVRIKSSGFEFSDWDFLHLHVDRSFSPAELCKYFKKHFEIDLHTIVYKQYLIWALYIRPAQTPMAQLLLIAPILQTLRSKHGSIIPEDISSLTLEIGAEGANAEEIDFPNVILHFPPWNS